MISMKRLFTPLILVSITIQAFAQCAIVPFSIQKKVYMSDVVVEAEVVSKKSYWNADHSFIFTNNVLKISAILKGSAVPTELNLLTEGGFVGLEGVKVDPSLELEVGDIGIFLIKQSDTRIQELSGQLYKPVASVQSFIKYDLMNRSAHGYFEVFEDVKGHLIPKIESYTNQPIERIGDNPFGLSTIRPLAAPSITSLDKDTINAGTGEVLTITGSNFGIIQGSGYVEFVDPNFGDGRYFQLNYPSSFKSWSNSKIEVYVPPRAGSGKIRVVNNGSERGTSTDEIHVRYSHSNYPYNGSAGGDSGYYQPKHFDMSGNGGYTWQMTNHFAGKKDAVNAFLRAAEKWRCGTLMNWDIGSNTATTGVAKDNVNIVEFTKFGDSRLGVCTSWYGGCIESGNKPHFYVSELDISFDSTRNWYYGTGNPANNQYDFETVATHELGHGHQLSHVIDDTKIMHYSLTNGDRKTTLHNDDITGAGYVRSNSLTGIFCSSKDYKSIKVEDCNITKPKAKFIVNIPSPCPGVNVRFTSQTEGKVTKYAWDFGDGASTGSASTVGPHVLNYSTSGEKTIQLIAENDFGKDTATLKLTVQPGKPGSPIAFTVDTACFGQNMYTVDSVAEGTSYVQWTVASGGAIVGDNAQNTVTVNWTSEGTHNLEVVGKNNCGTSDPLVTPVVVLKPAEADFDIAQDGLNATGTDKSVSTTKWAWYFGQGDTLFTQNAMHTYVGRGQYTVSLTASNACSDSTMTKSIDVKFRVGLENVVTSSLQIVPNPATDYIILKGEVNEYNVLIINDQGQEVMRKNRVHSSEQLHISQLAQGVYLYQITDLDGVTYKGKFVKE
jgi:PKD repeat protein